MGYERRELIKILFFLQSTHLIQKKTVHQFNSKKRDLRYTL